MLGETKDLTRSKMRRKRVLLGIAAVAVFGFAAAAWHFRLYARMVFVISEWRHGHEWKNRSLWLPDYRVVLQTRIEGVEKNLSGITWNSDTKTLFAVTNSPARLFELTGDGNPCAFFVVAMS